MVEGQFQSRGFGKAFIFITTTVAFVLCGSFVFASERVIAGGVETGPARYRVFSLKCISAEQGKKYLSEAGIGTVSQLPGANALLVTAQAAELIKASTILRLVDAEELFCIKAIFPALEAKKLPSNDEIEAKVGNILIGTFSNPPGRSEKAKAVIDIHGDAVIAIAPVEQLERIIFAIEQLQKAKTEALRPAETNKLVEPNQVSELKPEAIPLLRSRAGSEAQPEEIADSSESREVVTNANEPESDELFSKLLASLAEANKMAAEQAQQLSQPNKPTTAAVLPEATVPGEPSAAPKQVEELESQAAEQAPEVGAVEAIDVAEKPKPEPELEQVAVETEKPEEIAEPAVTMR